MYIITVRTKSVEAYQAFKALAQAIPGTEIGYEDDSRGPAKTQARDWDNFDALGLAQVLKIIGDMEKAFVYEVTECAKKKNIIGIIKAVRHYTGLGLKEAKDITEKYIPWRTP